MEKAPTPENKEQISTILSEFQDDTETLTTKRSLLEEQVTTLKEKLRQPETDKPTVAQELRNCADSLKLLTNKIEQRQDTITLFEKLPNEAKELLMTELENMSDTGLREHYLTEAAGATTSGNNSEVAVYTEIQGLVFEAAMINHYNQTGDEHIDTEFAKPLPIEIVGQDGTEQQSSIQIDVPINRDGMPYICEVKHYSRLDYGTEHSYKQLKKYQTAIEQNLVAGASIGIKGNVAFGFFAWAREVVPDVEVIYFFTLPSGQEYPVVICEAANRSNLALPTPNEATLTEADKQVIEQIKTQQAAGRLEASITSTPIEDPNGELTPEQLKQPFLKINDLETFKKYQTLRQSHLLQQLSY